MRMVCGSGPSLHPSLQYYRRGTPITSHQILPCQAMPLLLCGKCDALVPLFPSEVKSTICKWFRLSYSEDIKYLYQLYDTIYYNHKIIKTKCDGNIMTFYILFVVIRIILEFCPEALVVFMFKKISCFRNSDEPKIIKRKSKSFV